MTKQNSSTSRRFNNQMPYIASMTITFFGFYGFSYLVSWIMIKETGSPELLSQVLTITMLPAIALNLIAGKVVGVWRAKVVMIVTDLLTGLLFIGTYLLMSVSVNVVILLIVVSVLNKSIGVFYKLSNKTIIPELFVGSEIKRVNSLQTQVRQLSIMISSILVMSLLLVINPKMIISIIGILFLLSVIFDLQLHGQRSGNSKASTSRNRFKNRFKSSVKFDLLLAAIGYLVDALVIVLVPWLALVVLKSNWLLSLFLGCEAVGILLAPSGLKFWPQVRLSTLSCWLPVCLVLLYPIVPTMMIGMFGLGFVRGLFNVHFFQEFNKPSRLIR
ncbi:MFS transporter [Lactiplantibacillus mudanjiangensis]|uniref:MFS transporter n=1 Tax=Lactiplantibacillus mudanjiangensis TaxID=1296538 RepID=UPI00103264A7|nr:MFS transporter [Lactiplantibacillus mudanjiangensis]